MQEYRMTQITKEEIVPTALRMRHEGRWLVMIHGQVEPDVAAYANTYFLIVEASTPFLAIYSAGAALFRVMGNSGISMWVSLIMNAINVAGNAIGIFVLHAGVAGVAWPSTISRAFAAAAITALCFLVNGIFLLFSYPLLFAMEKGFGFTSNVTLVELSNVNNKLLRALIADPQAWEVATVPAGDKTFKSAVER